MGRTAKQRIPLPAPRSSPLRGGRVTVMVCFLLFFVYLNRPKPPWSISFSECQPSIPHLRKSPPGLQERGHSRKTACFYSPSLSNCSSILRPGTRNNKRWFKPKMRQLSNLRTWCFVFFVPLSAIPPGGYPKGWMRHTAPSTAKIYLFVEYLKACLELTLSWIVPSDLPF